MVMKSLFESDVKFTVNAPLAKVWEVLSDLERLGRCLPMVEEVRVIRPGVAEWTLKLTLGPIAKTIKLKSKVVRQDPPVHASFKAEGQDLSLTGQVNLQSLQSGGTEVHYRFGLDARGSLSKIIENIARRRTEPLKEETVDRIRNALE
jgi:carbon monoxide dehydrogenase subunit G